MNCNLHLGVRLTCFLTLIFAAVSLPQCDSFGNENHPISMIEADVYVGQRMTSMRLRTFADDLELLHGLEPDDFGTFDPLELKRATRDHAKFLAERITVRDELGELINPDITEIIDIEIPETGILAGDLMNYQLGFVFEFKHPTPPSFLTLQHNVIDEEFLFPAEVTLFLKQSGTDVNYRAMMKVREPETIRFDWDQPPLSREASEKEWNEWFDEQREKTLGISSYSSVYSFIYITDYEVRHEILIPLASLTASISFTREEESFLDVHEQDAAREQIQQFYATGNQVLIDGVEVDPLFDRIDFYGLDLRDFAMRTEQRKVSMGSGRVGVIMSYRTKGTPDHVAVTWDKFSPAVRTVESIIFAFDTTERTQFSSYLEDNTFEWKNPGRPPVAEIEPIAYEATYLQLSLISMICIVVSSLSLLSMLFVRGHFVSLLGLSMISLVISLSYANVTIPIESRTVPNQQAERIFNRLHTNLFRAFDYYDEEDSYDALARSVDGPLLRKLYLDIRKSLEVKEQGNAVSRIDQVNILQGEVVTPLPNRPLTRPGFAFKCYWNLIGTIEHWGHIHQRTNEYHALFNVENRDGEWKITSLEVLDQKQGPIKNSLRKF